MNLVYPRLWTLLLLLCAACPSSPRRGLTSVQRYKLSDAADSDGGKLADHLAYQVIDVKTGEILAEQRAKTPMIPASTTKIAAAVAALDVLGPDFKVRTTVSITGKIIKGVLQGDVYLIGQGDAQLTLAKVLQLARQFADTGIRSITGHLYYDSSYFATVAAIAPGIDTDEIFNPGVGALSLESNTQWLYWQPAANGTPGAISYYTVPHFDDDLFVRLELNNRNKRNALVLPPSALSDDDPADAWKLSPRAHTSGAQKIPVHDPGLFTAEVWRWLLTGMGVVLPTAVAAPRAAQHSKTVAAVDSSPLWQDIEKMLLSSDNLMAELFTLQVARHLTQKALTPPQAAESLSAYWKKKLTADSTKTFTLRSGAGLSSSNRVSPAALVEILKYADAKSYNGHPLMTLLPAAGWRGTLASRLTTPETSLRVWAKTGSLSFVSGLAGYVLSRSGRRLAFTVLLTDFNKRALYDSGNVAQAGDASGWNKEAHIITDRLVQSWAVNY